MTNKKTGTTPAVPAEDLSGGKVLGTLPVTTVLVKYADGYGKTTVRLAVVIPGGEVYFFSNNSLDMRPAQQWLKTAVHSQLGKPGSVSMIDHGSGIQITEDSQV